MSDKYLEAVASIFATDNDHNLEELWIEAQQAVEDEGDAARYDPSVLLYELYMATAKELVEAWVGDRELYEKKPYPYLGCEQCKQTGCPDCFDLVRVSVTEDEPT